MVKLTLSFKGRILRVIHANGDQTLIGRSPDCDVQIDNLGVSPVHARITYHGDQAVLADTSEEGSVLVNGKKISEQELQHGDAILIGKHTLTFAREASPAARTVTSSTGLGPVRNGWLQFLTGAKLGRTIRLDRNLVRLGQAGGDSAMIASRNDGYYISHLEGDTPTKVGTNAVGDQAAKLKDGDTIQVGDVRMLFFIDER